jgi:hypothetical protein
LSTTNVDLGGCVSIWAGSVPKLTTFAFLGGIPFLYSILLEILLRFSTVGINAAEDYAEADVPRATVRICL